MKENHMTENVSHKRSTEFGKMKRIRFTGSWKKFGVRFYLLLSILVSYNKCNKLNEIKEEEEEITNFYCSIKH